MKALLTLPGEVLNENLSGYTEAISLYKEKKMSALNKLIATKDYSGKVKSYFGNDQWDLSAYVDSKITIKNKISFSEINSDSLRDEMKIICFAWLYIAGGSRRRSPIKASTLIARHSKLTQIYKYLDSINIDSITHLSHPILFSEFCAHIKSREYSSGNASNIFSILTLLDRTYNYMPFEFIFPSDQSIGQLAATYSSSTKQQKDQFYAIPTRLMELIYGRCMEIIEEAHPHKELLNDLLHDLRKNYEHGKFAVDQKIKAGAWQWLNENSPDYRIEVNKHKPQVYKEIIDAYLTNSPLNSSFLVHQSRRFDSWIAKIQTACFIICSAFTGMRRSELYGLHPDSFKKTEVGSKKFYSLESFHHKMVQGKPQKTEWLTVPFTQKAIELAEALSRHMRQQLLIHEDPMKVSIASCLWLRQTHKSKAPKVCFEETLREPIKVIVAEANAMITDKDLEEFKLINPNCNPLHADKKIQVGKYWPVTTHQFRRTFAVFAKRHSLCSNIAIKQQFKHLDVPTSEWYGEGGFAAKLRHIDLDLELKNFIDTVQTEITTQKIHHWYNSKEKLYGKMGRSIAKDRTSLPKIYKSWDAIYEHVESGRLSLVGTLHSYCLAGYECQMSKISSPANCFKCENQLIDEAKANNWLNRHKWVSEQVIFLESTNNLSKSAYSHFITQIKAAEKVMKHFKIPFQQFNIENNDYE